MIASREVKIAQDKQYPCPNPIAHILRNEDSVEWYYSMVHDVIIWPLESKKEMIPAALIQWYWLCKKKVT